MKKHSLDKSTKYKKFIKDRDKALEKIYKDAQIQISNELNYFLVWLTDIIRSRVSRYVGKDNSAIYVMQLQGEIDKDYKRKKPEVAVSIFRKVAYMSVVTKGLAFTAQAEAIARATGKINPIKLDPRINVTKNPFGEDILARIDLALDRVYSRALDKVKMSLIDGADLNLTMERVIRSFPKKRRFKDPKRIKKLTEAKKKIPETKKVLSVKDTDLLMGTVDDDVWRQIVDAYKKEYQLDRRGPEYLISGKQEEPDAIYEWEIEQQAADEFYSKVMDADTEAAKEMGTDLVWIAVLDDRTGESDAWRDGMLLSEIKEYIDKHGSDAFGNDLLSPPIHPNCRCRVAPVTSDIPEPRVLDNEDFEAWLNAE